jgi:hypothetical protein
MPQLGFAIIVDDAVHNLARALQLRIARRLTHAAESRCAYHVQITGQRRALTGSRRR